MGGFTMMGIRDSFDNANTKSNVETNVPGLGTIVYCNDSSFDINYITLLNDSAKMISARDFAYARITLGKNGSIIRGSYIREGSLFAPKYDNRRIWLRKSLVLTNPTDAVDNHRNGIEYWLPKNFNLDRYLEDIGKKNYFILKDTDAIPTDRFGEDERTVFLFQDQAKEYGAYLKNAKISEVIINMYASSDTYIDKQLRPFANQLKLGNDSSIIGSMKHLHDDDSVYGLRHNNTIINPWDIEIPTIENKILDYKVKQ